jgi:glycosyltransferase involved in cell wall biosynthesis
VTSSEGPLVSVLVTTYQHAAFIDEALESIVQQSYRHIEIAVADDGSTDGTREHLQWWASRDTRVVPVLAPANGGFSANWNRGLERCTGEFLAFLSGDDQMLPGRLAAQLSFMLAHPDCGICTHDMELFDSASGRTLYRLHDRFAAKNGGPEVLFTTNWLFGRDVKAIPSSYMFRASAVANCRYDPRLRIMNEWLFEIECMMRSGLQWRTLPEVLGRYRSHEQQLSRSIEALSLGFEESMTVLAIAAARYPQLGSLVKHKRDFIIFQHLVFDWFPHEKRSAFERQFRVEAGVLRWLYMRAARLIVGRRWLLKASRPARRFVRWLQERA